MPILFGPPPLSKNCTFSDTKERRQFPKERENLRGGYIYSYIYSELGLVLELFLVQTSEKGSTNYTPQKKVASETLRRRLLLWYIALDILPGTYLTVTCVIYLEWYLR